MQVNIEDKMFSLVEILILPCQVVFKSFANSCHHLRSLSLEWQEKPEDLVFVNKNQKTWGGSRGSRPHWGWKSQWEDPSCLQSNPVELPLSPSNNFEFSIVHLLTSWKLKEAPPTSPSHPLQSRHRLPCQSRWKLPPVWHGQATEWLKTITYSLTNI